VTVQLSDSVNRGDGALNRVPLRPSAAAEGRQQGSPSHKESHSNHHAVGSSRPTTHYSKIGLLALMLRTPTMEAVISRSS
jgi:hypothetical protein